MGQELLYVTWEALKAQEMQLSTDQERDVIRVTLFWMTAGA